MTAAKRNLPLDRPLPISELAKHADMKIHRMRRWLFRLQKKHPDAEILTRVENRWMVLSLARLQEFWPDFGKRFFSAADVEVMATEVKDLKRDLRAAQARIRKLEQAVTRLVTLSEAGSSRG